MRSHRRPPVAPTPSESPPSQDTARENPTLCWACWASLPSPFLQHSFHPPHVSPVNTGRVQRCSDNGIFNHKGPTVAVPRTMLPPPHAIPTFWDLLGQRLCDLGGLGVWLSTWDPCSRGWDMRRASMAHFGVSNHATAEPMV